MIDKEFSPTFIQYTDDTYFIQFDNNEKRTIFITLKKERDSKNPFIYGESHTVYADADFHIFALSVVNYIAKQIGCKFFVDDATDYLKHRSKEQLEKYIKEFNVQPAVSYDLFRKAMIEHQNRQLDINEIISRETDRNA